MVLIAHVQCAVALSGGLLLFLHDAYATPKQQQGVHCEKAGGADCHDARANFGPCRSG